MRVVWKFAVKRGKPFQLVQLVRCLTDSSETLNQCRLDGSSYRLPWTQHPTPFSDREPFINRTLGLYYLRKYSNAQGYSFRVSEFLQSVKEAVFSLAEILSTPDRQDSLESVLHPRLCERVTSSLEDLPSGSRMHLDVESIRQLQLCSVNSIAGEAASGDEHVFSFLGQQVIASRSELQATYDINNGFTFRAGRELVWEAVKTRLEFQVGVRFKTKEKFAVLNSAGEMIAGSNQFQDCYHMWRFCSDVALTREEYPFSWTVLDINDHLTSAQQSVGC